MRDRNRVRHYTAADGYVATDLMRYAHDHYDCAMRLFGASPSAYDSAGYLAQLSLELLLKATMLHRAGFFTNEHDLLVLLQESGLGSDLPGHGKGVNGPITFFNQFFSLRYPNPSKPIGVGTRDSETLTDLWATLHAAIPRDLLEGYSEVIKSTPIKGNRVFMVKKKADGLGNRAGANDDIAI